MDRLTELLNNISDTYYDFVVGVLNYAKRSSENLEDMTAFIENHPEADTSDILEYMINRDDYYEHAQRIVGVQPQRQTLA